jgi:DNA-binding transcriptional LysR family regulator
MPGCSNNTQLLLAVALVGAGIACGPTFMFGEHLRRADLVAMLPAYRACDLTIQADDPGAARIPLKVRRFVDNLAGTFGNEPPWDRKAGF